MWLTRLEADRLRNLKAVDLHLQSGLTFVVGRNGQGKSSLLEAVYVLGTGRSFRTRRTDEAVSRSGGPMRVAGTVRSRNASADLCVIVAPPERRLLVGKEEKDLESYLGRLDVVDLTGGRMQTLKGGPDERRRFLDRGVVGLRPGFLRVLGEYRRLLEQRNALLRKIGRGGPGGGPHQLDAWDERLVRAGTSVHRHRREYAERLSAELHEAGRVLFSDGESLGLRYRPSPATPGGDRERPFEEHFGAALERCRQSDLGLGFTSVGPHRDELVAELDGMDLRRFGSAGQLRSAMIVLKLAKLRILRESRGEIPIFLMDDFDSDVDEARAAALAEFLRAGDFQTVAASSKETMTDRIGLPCGKVRMEGGAARVI